MKNQFYDNRSNWTSSFTNWVFDANRKKKKEREIDEVETAQLYEEGITAENAIEELKYWAKDFFQGARQEIWEQYYIDAKEKNQKPPFVASSLKLNGEPIV